MRRRRERQLDTYRDGELSPRARQRLERELELDAAGTRRLAEMAQLGSVIREAWTDGPPAPAPEFLVNALRSELRRVDKQRAQRSLGRRLRQRLGELLRPVPVTALAGGAMAGLLLVWLGSPVVDQGYPVASESLPTLASPAAIYDLDQSGAGGPLLVYELEDGVTVIWLLEEDAKISSLPRGGSWV
ncbi:MAG: hypothetical protein E2O71_11625 [Deltaproteobacteria bacterium]|nr:MAG: hypothetical protein E2O71_11625 [Deltaproteobacteria bacterium]